MLNRIINKAKIEVRRNLTAYILLSLILVFSFLLRVWRIDQLLGFYYDQGRDAQVIWDLWHKGKLFLIGPTTGIEGIFRGPYYYWLIAPFYFLGQGSPVYPSVFLSFTTVVAIFVAFLLAKEALGYIAGLLASVICGFSFYFIFASRWLSNPTPMLLVSMLLVGSLFLIVKGKKVFWIVLTFLLGMAMQFGSAAEVFYFPAVLIFAIWQRRILPSFPLALLCVVTLLGVFLPQIVFDLKHDGILRDALSKFLFKEESFKLSFWEIVKIRLPFYFDTFFAKIFPIHEEWRSYLMISVLGLFLLSAKTLTQNRYFLAILLLFVSPLVGMLFFQGNYGNVYDYYFTGYYFIFALLLSLILASSWRFLIGKILVIIFLIAFIKDNLPLAKNYVSAGVDGEMHITLGNELQALDWVFQDSLDREFNVDVYVPPVIPHAYDYLFLWQGYLRCGLNLCNLKLDHQVPLLYTLYEVDPPHPERLEAWLARQKGIGQVEEKVRYGGIIVERRARI